MSVVIEESRQSQAGPGKGHPPDFWSRFFISCIRFLVVVALAAAIGGGWYLAKKGFGREWRRRVVEELHKRGVEVSIRRLTLNPFRGLVAKDVRVFDYKNRGKTLALVSEISLDINYAAFFHRQPFLNAIDVRNAQIWLPLTGTDNPAHQPRLKNFKAHVYFPPEQIYVSQAEGVLAGIRISVTGQLIKRDNYTPSPALSEEEWQQRLKTFSRIVAEVQQCSFPGGSPNLQVKFSGDLADMENAHVDVSLRADVIRRGNYEARNLFAAADYADQRFNVNQCEWTDSAGSLAARASWARQTGDVDFQIRSSLDLKSLLESFKSVGPLAEVTFQSSPHIELSGGLNVGQPRRFKALGQVTIGSFTYETVPLSDLNAAFSWDADRLFIHDLRMDQHDGQLRAELLSAPSDFRLTVDSTVNPRVLKDFLSPEMQAFLREWEWQTTPSVHLDIRGPDQRPESWKGDGTVSMGRTRFRGAWMNSATSKIHFGDGAVTYENLRVVRDEGVGTGSFTYDFKKHEVRFSNIRSSLTPSEVILWIDPKLLKSVTPYKFRQPPNLTTNGLYQFGGGRNTRFEIHVDAPRGVEYVFLGKTLPFDHLSTNLVFTKDRLQIVDLKGAIFSGTATGSAEIALGDNDKRYHARMSVSQINFTRLTELYFNYKSAQGQLDGSYDFTGVGSDSRKMRGTGKLEVTRGDVFAIPVFGPLSDILNTILPGSGYSIARKATAGFSIKDGIFHTDDFEAQGKLFSMLGHGDVYFIDDKLDFTIRMDMHGPGVLLTPMYKLFEYEGTGSAKHPDWHPKRF